MYDRTSRAFYSNFVVTPGQGLGGGSGAPYGSINAVYADVKAEYRTAAVRGRGGNGIEVTCHSYV